MFVFSSVDFIGQIHILAKTDASWLENALNMKTFPFHLQGSFGCSININTIEDLFASKVSSSGLSHVSSLFTKEEQKRLARDVFSAFATHSSLVLDVTDTDC